MELNINHTLHYKNIHSEHIRNFIICTVKIDWPNTALIQRRWNRNWRWHRKRLQPAVNNGTKNIGCSVCEMMAYSGCPILPAGVLVNMIMIIRQVVMLIKPILKHNHTTIRIWNAQIKYIPSVHWIGLNYLYGIMIKIETVKLGELILLLWVLRDYIVK